MDWEEGQPPYGMRAAVWMEGWGSARTGKSDGTYFRFDDCVHPLQNSAIPVESVRMWAMGPEDRRPTYDAPGGGQPLIAQHTVGASWPDWLLGLCGNSRAL